MANLKDVEYWYSEALKIPSEERVSYLENQLTLSPDLLEEVKTLVLSNVDEQSLLTQLREQLTSDTDVDNTEDFPAIGKYELLEEIGRGGMAVVYRASRTDGVFDQEVAVKVLKRGMDTDDIIRRFRQERNLLARLKHPNVGQIHDGGVTSDGRPYFVMELIEGRDIVEYCQENNLLLTERLQLFIKACQAVEFAHQNLIIHRDIKPSNILVNESGEVKLMDFGIAKLVSDGAESDFTLGGQKVLTPKFASPEQLNNELVDVRSDVYQLGKVLELLLLDLETDSDLTAISQFALREERKDRYSNVSELLNDIQRFFKGKPVTAFKGNNLYAFKKFVSRNRLKVGSASAIVLMLIASIAAYIWQERNTSQRILAEKDIAEGTLNAFLGIFELAYPAHSQGDTLDAFDLLVIGDTLLSESDIDPIIQSKFLNLIGEIYYGFNEQQLAKRYFSRSVAVFESADLEYKDARENLFRVYGNLVDIYLDLNNLDSAYYYLGLNEQFAAQNENYDYTLSNIYGRVAWLEANRRNYTTAIEYYEKSIAAVPESTAPIFLAIKKTFYARFLCYYDVKGYEPKIDSLYTSSYQIFLENDYDKIRKNDFATLANFIGIFHMDLDRLDSAQHYFEKALAINLKLFGENNLATLDNINNLTLIRLKRGDYIYAREKFKDLWLRANKAGVLPASRLVYYKNYARTFNETKDFKTAEFKFDSLVNYRKKYVQNDLVRLIKAKNDLVTALVGLKKYKRAEKLLYEIISDHEKSMDKRGEQDLRAYIELAKIKKLQGDEEGALSIKSENRDRILERLSADSEVYALNEEL